MLSPSVGVLRWVGALVMWGVDARINLIKTPAAKSYIRRRHSYKVRSPRIGQ
jgi:hypothetical protein